MPNFRAILFDRPALQALEGVLGLSGQVFEGLVTGLRFNIAKGSELMPAGLAYGDGVVGVVIWEREDGSPAFQTLERNVDLVFGHGAHPDCERSTIF